MPDEPDIAKAKAAVAELLQSLGIVRVICVDDVYAHAWTIEDVQAAQFELDVPNLLATMPEFGAAVPDDRDIRRQRFREVWDVLDSALQNDRAKKIFALAGATHPGAPEDHGVASTLEEIVGADFLTTYSPAAWEQQEASVISENRPALVLFDQDLSGGGGSATGGMALVKNLQAKDNSANLVCGLLTHTATMANQHERWQELSQTSGVNRDRFVVVPKQFLSQDPIGFARMLKLVALSPDCQKLKAKIGEMLTAATSEAAKQVDAITVFDFDHMVFRNAYAEGVWEPDMLYRLHAIFHRTELRKQSLVDQEVSQLLERPRIVSLIPTDSESKPAPSSWRLQRQEMYEAAEYLNGLHLPIEIGDIFQKTDANSAKSFILLGQPCDLMVRSDGKRAPEITDVTLAEVSVSDKSKVHSELLPCFGDDPAVNHYVMFRRVHVLDPCVLDLCVFNSNGAALMDLSTPCPNRLTPAWKKRFEVLRRKSEAIVGRYAKFAEGRVADNALMATLRQDAIRAFPPFISNSGVFKATVELAPIPGRIAFNCKRVGRLCRPRAAALALQYAACISRPAFDREL